MVNNPVLKTLIYENIFKFPLYKEEIWSYLISDKKINKTEFEKFLKDKNINFDKSTNLYFLAGDKKIVNTRINREKISQEKNILATRAAKLISIIPTIYLIGISGSLAQNSSKESDDIDFFIIAKKNTVWTTRLFSILVLKVKGIYRGKKKSKNRICINMITDGLNISDDRRDLYTAFEIAQLRPLFDRNKTYEKFIRSNNWVIDFLPNFKSKTFTGIRSNNFFNNLFSLLDRLGFEILAKLLQLKIMKKVTKEIVTDHLLAFHPHDSRSEILSLFNRSIGRTRGH